MFERKTANAGIADVDKKSRTIVGYASTFGNKDLHRDVVVKGAFQRTLNNNPHKVKVFMHHDPVLLVGKPNVMNEDEKGLLTESHISDTANGRDLLTLVEDGVLTDLSIGFRTIQDDYDEKSDTRYIKEAQLFEYSFVSIPANPEANIVGIKGYDNLNTVLTSMQRFEKALRDGTFEGDDIPERLDMIVKNWREQLDTVLYAIKSNDEEVTPSDDVVPSESNAEKEIDFSGVTNLKELRSLLAESDSSDDTRNAADPASETDSSDDTQIRELASTFKSRAAQMEMEAAMRRIRRRIRGDK